MIWLCGWNSYIFLLRVASLQIKYIIWFLIIVFFFLPKIVQSPVKKIEIPYLRNVRFLGHQFHVANKLYSIQDPFRYADTFSRLDGKYKQVWIWTPAAWKWRKQRKRFLSKAGCTNSCSGFLHHQSHLMQYKMSLFYRVFWLTQHCSFYFVFSFHLFFLGGGGDNKKTTMSDPAGISLVFVTSQKEADLGWIS